MRANSLGRQKRRGRLACAGCAGLILITLLALATWLEYLLGETIDVNYPVLVKGTVIDMNTGSRLDGVWVVPVRVRDREESLDAARARKAALQVTDATGYSVKQGVGLTDESGEFSFLFNVPWPKRIGLFGSDWGSRDRPPPYHEFEALLVGARARAERIVDTRRGKWTRKDTSAVFAILDMGQIELR